MKPKKINVYYRSPSSTGKGEWAYLHSSMAYRTCRDAVKGAQAKCTPLYEYKASFAK